MFFPVYFLMFFFQVGLYPGFHIRNRQFLDVFINDVWCEVNLEIVSINKLRIESISAPQTNGRTCAILQTNLYLYSHIKEISN